MIKEDTEQNNLGTNNKERPTTEIEPRDKLVTHDYEVKTDVTKAPHPSNTQEGKNQAHDEKQEKLDKKEREKGKKTHGAQSIVDNFVLRMKEKEPHPSNTHEGKAEERDEVLDKLDSKKQSKSKNGHSTQSIMNNFVLRMENKEPHPTNTTDYKIEEEEKRKAIEEAKKAEKSQNRQNAMNCTSEERKTEETISIQDETIYNPTQKTKDDERAEKSGMQETTRLGQTRQKVKNILNAVQQAKDDLIDYIQDDLNIIDLSM